MAEYEVQPTVVFAKNEVLKFTTHWKKSGIPESILGSEFFYRNKMEFSFSNSRG
jgi:hypothetical protein